MDIVLISAGIVAVLAATTTVATVLTRVMRLVRRLGHLTDDLFGEPARDGVPARPGVMQRLHAIETTARNATRRLNAIESELRPNSGTSLRDAVDRVEQHINPHPPAPSNGRNP